MSQLFLILYYEIPNKIIVIEKSINIIPIAIQMFNTIENIRP